MSITLSELSLRTTTMMLKILLSVLISMSSFAFAGAGDVAKAIVVRGKAMAQMPDGKVVEAKQGMWFKEGTQVKTADKSFVKLLFIDKSQMNLGPNSQMKIDKFPENDPGIVTLVKGQLRSKVSKNYMEMDKKDKSKLFIKTKTAAMGVRGTDFQVDYNPSNDFTSLVTFEGAVAMASLTSFGKSADLFDQTRLERIVSSDQAVTVTRGQFSGSSPETGTATIPVKINPMQLENMEKNQSGSAEEPSESSAAVKPVKSIVPPGVNGQKFSNKAKVESQVAKSSGQTVVNKATAAANTVKNGFAPTKITNTAAAGAVVDVATGNLLLPPKNAPIDTNTGLPILTGASSVLSNTGVVNMEAAKSIDTVVVSLNTANQVAIQTQTAARSPASVGGAPAGNPLLAGPTVAVAQTQEEAQLLETGGELLVDAQETITDNQDLGLSNSTSTVNFNLNVQ
ncbi:MAG: hypothetical protein COW01_00490 [Bdellovibrionales bacterium CG12_big_fil_rev_8_21_14_0_65_38_15]|nr:MAG: hypothetical protein COW79_10020 [Bdellovibrionales bacterium CG22_combo_CG10-13_8_21_14_all_38_13]PIQ57444.1 MAG: hypothetical protein COW01_00490 [Bdellovibrionales bacterium CG12_big_fil_rev_8_21_14_0_65_38_15]PIR31165.1 MAG: hypothetical protein COV38_01970 [Bdellovibrionales bacterium CG11_big_fil_rev_8_21_14_0_20_38_13]